MQAVEGTMHVQIREWGTGQHRSSYSTVSM